jgi:hypothetical protein
MVNQEGDVNRLGNQSRCLSYVEIVFRNKKDLFVSDISEKECSIVDRIVVLNFKIPSGMPNKLQNILVKKVESFNIK